MALRGFRFVGDNTLNINLFFPCFTTLSGFFQEGVPSALLLHKTVAKQVPNDGKLNLFAGISPL